LHDSGSVASNCWPRGSEEGLHITFPEK
jgi:hypothetical protein